MRFVLYFLLATLLCQSSVIVQPATAAPILYGSVHNDIRFGPSTLVELDPATGALVQTIGSIGFQVVGMAYNTSTGQLLGTTWNGSQSSLIEINQTTGAGTAIGTTTGLRTGRITFNSANQLFGEQQGPDRLLTVNTTTGVSSDVGPYNVGQNVARDTLDFDAADQLYLLNSGGSPVGRLYTVDDGTGLATFVGNISGMTAGNDTNSGGFHPDTGLLYAISARGAESPPHSIYQIDVNTLSVVGILSTVDKLHSLAFTDSTATEPAPVPEPTSLAIWSLLGVVGAGYGLRRRRR